MALSVANLSQYPIFGSSVESAGNGLSGFSSYPYTPGTVYVAGFQDGSQVSKLFYCNNTSGAVVPLPTLVSVKQTVSPAEPGGSTKTGGYTVQVLYGSGTGGISPEASSPSIFYLDESALLIIASTNVG